MKIVRIVLALAMFIWMMVIVSIGWQRHEAIWVVLAIPLAALDLGALISYLFELFLPKD